MTFAEFKMSQPAQAMFRKLDLLEYLAGASSWRDLRELIVAYNNPDQGHFVNVVRQCDGVCSSGERVLLHAIATVCDFAWLADELGAAKKRQNGPWENMNRASGEWLRAVAACITALDEV